MRSESGVGHSILLHRDSFYNFRNLNINFFIDSVKFIPRLLFYFILKVIKNSLSFCFSLSASFPYYLPAELRIIILEVWQFIIQQVNNNALLPHCLIKNQPFSCKKSAKLRIGSICTQKCCQIKNRQTSKCCRFVIRQITQTQTETETEAVRSHF